MTGAPMPMDASQRMQMAPAVYDFTKNFARKPNILEKTGNLVKNIGKTIGTGMAVAAAAPAYAEQKQESTPTGNKITVNMSGVEEQETTADSYDQPLIDNQTAGNTLYRSALQNEELGNNDTIAEQITKSQDLLPATKEEELSAKLKDDETTAGLARIGGPENISDKVQEFLKQDKLNPVLLAAMQNRGQEEELIATDFPIASQLSDNPQIPGGEDTRALSREFVKETEPIDSGIPTNVDPSTLTPEVRNVLSTLAKGAATIPLEKQIRIAQDIVDKRSPNEVFGFASKDADTLKALQGGAGIPQQEREAARNRLLEKTAQKRKELGIDAPSTMKKVTEFLPQTMTPQKSSFVENMKMYPPSGDKPNVVSFQMKNSEKEYPFKMSDPMAVSMGEMAEDGSLAKESFGKLFNLAKKSVKDGSGMFFGIEE